MARSVHNNRPRAGIVGSVVHVENVGLRMLDSRRNVAPRKVMPAEYGTVADQQASASQKTNRASVIARSGLNSLGIRGYLLFFNSRSATGKMKISRLCE